jgi:hypothetical protein
MTALCKPYDDPARAHAAVDALISAGVPAGDVRVLMGADVHDARREAAGGFDGSVASDARVGAFAGAGPARSSARGTFAGHADDREGVFSNADRDVVVTHSDGREHARVAGHQRLKRLLLEAGLDEPTAESDVRALHEGRVLVLVTIAAVSEGEARALLDAA